MLPLKKTFYKSLFVISVTNDFSIKMVIIEKWILKSKKAE